MKQEDTRLKNKKQGISELLALKNNNTIVCV